MDLIDRQFLITHLNECIVSHGIAHSPLIDAALTAIKCAVEQMPAAEQKRGEWKESALSELTGNVWYECSECGALKKDIVGANFCHRCGADMRSKNV